MRPDGIITTLNLALHKWKCALISSQLKKGNQKFAIKHICSVTCSLICLFSSFRLDFPDGSADKVSAWNAGDTGDPSSIPRSGRSPGEGTGNHSSTFAWKIAWTYETGGLQSNGRQRVGQDSTVQAWHHGVTSDPCSSESSKVSQAKGFHFFAKFLIHLPFYLQSQSRLLHACLLQKTLQLGFAEPRFVFTNSSRADNFAQLLLWPYDSLQKCLQWLPSSAHTHFPDLKVLL